MFFNDLFWGLRGFQYLDGIIIVSGMVLVPWLGNELSNLLFSLIAFSVSKER
jgi:hypothetical protein